MTQPKAINASNFLIFLEIITGISKTPGTVITRSLKGLIKVFLALSNNELDMTL